MSDKYSGLLGSRWPEVNFQSQKLRGSHLLSVGFLGKGHRAEFIDHTPRKVLLVGKRWRRGQDFSVCVCVCV
jgi:hypothetical protein